MSAAGITLLAIALLALWLAAGVAVAYLLFGGGRRQHRGPAMPAPASDPADHWGWLVWPAGCILAIAASCLWPMGFAS